MIIMAQFRDDKKLPNDNKNLLIFQDKIHKN